MKHDENNFGKESADTRELEARVVAAVLGEASAFELAELDRMLAEKPELAVFKKRIEAVHGLVGDANRPEKEPLQVSPERRAKLLAALGSPVATPAPEANNPTAAVTYPYGRRLAWRRALPIAAGLMIGLFVSVAIKYSAPGYKTAALSEHRKWLSEEVARPANATTPAQLETRENDSAPTPDAAGQISSAHVDRALADEKREIALSESPRTSADLNAAEQAKPMAEPQLRFAPRDTFAARTSGAVASPPPAAPQEAGARLEDGTVLMPKFEVKEDSQRYFAANSLAGSRVNSKLAAVDVPNVAVPPLTFGVEASAPEAKQKWSGSSGASKKGEGSTTNYYVQDAPDAPASSPRSSATAGGVPATSPSRGSDLALTGKETQLAQNDSEMIELSPFTVSTPSKDKGYLSFNGRDKKAVNKSASRSDGEKVRPAAVVKPQAPPQPSRDESRAAQQPVSTFSLHVSDVSFRLAHAALVRGEMPDATSIRPEEFYNAFNYGDPAPAMTDKVACRIEQSAHPMLQQRNLVRIAVKVPATGHGAGQPLRLTVLLDTSGSMEREDRAAAVRSALGTLVSLLGANDRLTLIGFSRQPRLLAEDLPGDRAREALDLLSRTPAEGGTNLEEALNLARDLARRHQTAGAQNRIVLLTDGAANLGNADPAKLSATIEALRQQGIAFDACGVGTEGVDDSMLEALTRKGDGRYYVLNSAEAADANFARQLAGAFRPAAQNVKLQVRFNPARVGSYRLIGFEQHRLKEEDFRNDKVDAAELAADEAAIAVYQVETLPQGEGEVGEVYVRFRDNATGNMVERSWTLSYDAHLAAFDRSTPSMQLAGVAALLAEKLQGGPAAEQIKLDDLVPVVNRLRGHYANEPRVQELVQMFEQLRRMEIRRD